jgi:hypothetical protein
MFFWVGSPAHPTKNSFFVEQAGQQYFDKLSNLIFSVCQMAERKLRRILDLQS